MGLFVTAMVGGDDKDGAVCNPSVTNGLDNDADRRVHCAESLNLFGGTPAIFVAEIVGVGKMDKAKVGLVTEDVARGVLGDKFGKYRAFGGRSGLSGNSLGNRMFVPPIEDKVVNRSGTCKWRNFSLPANRAVERSAALASEKMVGTRTKPLVGIQSFQRT